ncbi:protein kinase domain-containing protein [Nostoc sp. ChiQUE01b]|uniref:protein kinase domain-containing protein n=1 Tax=Nostoc sp. ChiQUE01b TaxID=3075376 RepID=UPI002AD4D712|nr:protein kinase [Nostoc sp. ChiQUE01b]MDZ8257728.1 protein kinase [Nostoc sp. ChiQUE01b]
MFLEKEDNLQQEDENYSFKTLGGNSQTFYLTLDEKGQPIKLGDGTFGIVFAVHNSNIEDKFAVKLLYDHKIDQSRFDNEIKSTQEITRAKGERKIFGVIRTVGWTDLFQQSNVYNTLKVFFEKSRISNYALVTERYDATLKDILERDGTQNTEEEKSEYTTAGNLTGYDILRQMSFEDRIANILPYLKDIAQGLVTLHKANLLHLDMKPANIFVNEEGSEVKAVIGDLGFLLPKRDPITSSLPIANADLPLGTRHYRSPEQKDYFDICDADIQVDSENQKVELISTDPKLRDSIIGDKDFVVFSKNQEEYEIDSIYIDKNLPIRIVLHVNDEAIKNINNDHKTQILLYKRQGIQTDLFGLGAILFDLLTCGESPERFYDNIRVIYDKKEKKVDEIMEDYEKVFSLQSSEPSLVQVFEPFKLHKDSTTYAPREIVEIILKCILYKAGNTFYTLSNDSSDLIAVQLVLDKILELEVSRRFDFRRTNNSLYRRNWEKENNSSTTSFLEALKELQNLDKDKLPARLVRGFWYLDKICELVNRSLQSLSSQNSFSFSELHPSNLIIRETNREPENLNIRFQAYKTEESYHKDLRGDSVYTKITRDLGNPFVPNYLAFLRRKIKIKELENKEYEYEFLDSSYYRNNIEKGDWVILKPQNNTTNILLQVESSQGFNLTFKPISFKEDNKDEDEVLRMINNITNSEIVREIVYYQNIDPCVYYLNMIAIYIYNIFFVGIKNNTSNKPGINDIVNSLLTMNNSLNNKKIKIREAYSEQRTNEQKKSFFTKIDWSKQPKNVKTSKIQEILDRIASIYLKLTVKESDNSYYNRKGNKQRINLLLEDIEKLKHNITDFLNSHDGEIVLLRSYPSDEVLEEIPTLSKLINNSQIGVSLEFDKLTSSLVEVQSGNSTKRLDEMLTIM